MTISKLKLKINEAIANVEDKEFLKAVYALINNKKKQTEYEYSTDLKMELEESSILYKAGKLKTYTVDEVIKKVEKNLAK